MQNFEEIFAIATCVAGQKVRNHMDAEDIASAANKIAFVKYGVDHSDFGRLVVGCVRLLSLAHLRKLACITTN